MYAVTWWRRTRMLVAALQNKLKLSVSIRPEPDDVFLVSFPKSGNTWMRFLIANLLHQDDEINFANIERCIPPDCSHLHMLSAPRPRVVKSHRSYTGVFRRVIYITRDPRDVAASLYHYRKKKRYYSDNVTVEQFLNDFLSGIEGTKSLWNNYGTWGENVGSWLGARWGTDAFLCLRYEDLLQNPHDNLRRVAVFLGQDADADAVERAVRRSSVSEMKLLEQRQIQSWRETKDTRSDIPFVRKATAGAWPETLVAAQAQRIVDAWGDLMCQLGYLGEDTSCKTFVHRDVQPANREFKVQIA